MPKTMTIKLTPKELWEVICILSMSFESGHPDNKVADSALSKMQTVYHGL